MGKPEGREPGTLGAVLGDLHDWWRRLRRDRTVAQAAREMVRQPRGGSRHWGQATQAPPAIDTEGHEVPEGK